MMWSASELTPTASGSMPSGLKPRAVMCSRSPTIQIDRAAGDVGAAQAGQRLRHRAVGGDHAGAVEAADDERVRRRIGGADHHRLGLAAADGVHRQLQRHAEGRAGGHRREGEAGDPAEHRDLRRRRVVDVPQDVGGHLARAASGAPHFFCSLPRAASLFESRASCRCPTLPSTPVISIARARRGTARAPASARPSSGARRPRRPAVLRLRVRGGRGGGRRRHALARGAAVFGEVVAQGAVALRVGPEAVPAPLRAVERERGVVERADVAEAGADVDVGRGAERLQLLLDARVLAQRLDEGADRVERRQSIFSSSWAKRPGGKRSSIQAR